MKEIALHILDIVQNSVNANASLIEIFIEEQKKKNTMSIEILDNGCGMDQNMIDKLIDPFFTTKDKKTGLGIPLLKQHAELTGGEVSIQSKEGESTKVKAIFGYDHIDRQPLGDISGTICGLIRSYPSIDWIYKHKINNQEFILDTREIKKELEQIDINSKEIIKFIKEMIRENIFEISNQNL